MIAELSFVELIKYTDRIRNLPPDQFINLSRGTDHLDLIALDVYGSYDYWRVLAIKNGVINPLNLLDQGLTVIHLPRKSDLDSLMAGVNNDRVRKD